MLNVCLVENLKVQFWGQTFTFLGENRVQMLILFFYTPQV